MEDIIINHSLRGNMLLQDFEDWNNNKFSFDNEDIQSIIDKIKELSKENETYLRLIKMYSKLIS